MTERVFQASQSLFTFRQTRLTRVLTHRAAEQRCQRPAHPACVGAGEIGAGDQRVGSQRAALIGPQRRTLPFGRPAVGGVQPGARHIDFDPARTFPVSDRVRLP